jgi:hypothetical protein
MVGVVIGMPSRVVQDPIFHPFFGLDMDNE